MKNATRLACLLLLLATAPASAELYTPPPANAPPGANSSWGQQKAYCNNVCSSLVNGNGKILGLNGTVGWTVADDLWCANHGSQTNPLISPSPIPGAAAPPSESCPVTQIPGDTNCKQTVAMTSHCAWHNGQLEQQCEAYEAAGGANTGQDVVLALDIAATGTCAAACAGNLAAGPLVAACRIAGTAATTTELIETLTQKSSAMAKAMSSVMGGIGDYYGTIKPIKSLGAKNYFHGGAKDSDCAGGTCSNTNKGNGRMKDAACKSAAMFAAMTGMRYMDIHSAQSTQKTACSQVTGLASSAPTIGAGGIPIPTNLASGAGSTGATGAGSTGATETASSGLNCVSGGGSVSSCTGTSPGTADVAALQSSGLGQQLAPQAAQIANALPSMSGGASGAVQSAAGAAGAPGDITGAVSTVAAAAQAQSHELFDKSGSMGGSGGGGGGDDSGGAPPNPMDMLAALLGHKGGGAPAGGVQNYRGVAENHDIWHANSPDNLFQIVSTRIQKVTPSLSQ